MNARPFIVSLGLLAICSPLTAEDIAPNGPEALVSTNEIAKQRNPSVFFDRVGRHKVVWENTETGIVVRRYDVQGRAQGNDLHLVHNVRVPSVPGQGDVLYHREPAAVPAGFGGDFFVFFSREDAFMRVTPFHQSVEVRSRQVFGQRFDVAGNPVGAAFRVDRGSPFATRPRAAVAPNGDVLVVFERDNQVDGQQQSDGIWGRLYNREGVARGAMFRISVPGDEAARPDVTVNRKGMYLVSWEHCCSDGDSLGVVARFVTPAGRVAGQPLQVNQTTEGSQRRPALSAGPQGTYLIAWQGQTDSPFEARIYARILSSLGEFITDELEISTASGDAEVAPAVTATATGGYLVSWLVYIHPFPVAYVARELGMDGAARAEEFVVNTGTVNAHFRTAMASNGDGGYVAAWEGFAGDDIAIRAQELGGGSAGSGGVSVLAEN